MENPYSASNAPLAPDKSNNTTPEKSITIDTTKGPVTLSLKGLGVELHFNGAVHLIPIEKFTTSVFLLFARNKSATFKPIKVSAEMSDQKFRELLDFFGVDRFQSYDIQTTRYLHLVFGIIFPFLGWLRAKGTMAASWDVFAVGLILFGVFSLTLFTLTFSRLYLIYYFVNATTSLLLGIGLLLMLYSDGSWWITILLFFALVGAHMNFKKFWFFRSTPVLPQEP